MNSKKKFSVALSTIAFALVVASPVGAVCSISTLNECDNNGLIAVIAQLMGGSQTTTTTTTTTTGTTAIAACQGITFDRNLTVGSSGADVKCLQALLNQSADTQVAATGVGSAGNETTYFGSKTTAAVMAYQTKNAISPVAGYVGPITRASLNAALTASTTTGTGTGTTTTYPAGCTSSTGYSPTTGQACSGTTTTTTYPAGCTSATGYSPTTGQACSGTTTTTTTGEALTVALASDTPAGGNVLIGEANKAITKVIFTAGADADAVINTLKIKSYGTADLNGRDISRVKVYDENGNQLGSQPLTAGTAILTFSPTITVTKGTSKALTFEVTMVSAGAGTATASATVRLGLVDASSIGGTVFGGTFPIVGNSYTIVAGGSLGTLTVNQTPVVSVNSVGAGTSNVTLGNFVVSAGSQEDVSVKQIVISLDGNNGNTALDTDVTNIRVSVDGTNVGTASAFVNRKVTVNLSSPIALTRGASKNVSVIGDIVNGANRNVLISMDIDGVSGTGVTSGVGISNTAPATNVNDLINITAGTFSVSVSSSTPQGTGAQLVRSTTPQTLGAFDIRANGEDVLLTDMGINFNVVTAAGALNSVGLYNAAGSLISTGTVDISDVTSISNQSFALSTTIPANTTQTIYVKGVTSGITTGGTIATKLARTLDSNTKSVKGTGMVSTAQTGTYVTSNFQLALPAITISLGPTATISGDPLATPVNQAILSPASQVTVGTVKVTAQKEDQTLRNLVLTAVTTGENLDALVSSVALYDGTTQVTNFVSPASGATAVTFSGSDILTPAVTFVKGTPKTLRAVANTLGSLNGKTLRFTIATGDGNTATVESISTLGKDSGQIWEKGAVGVTDLRNSVGAATEAGEYTLNTEVIEVAKDAASPSGTVGRGTFQTYATWDINAFGTTNDIDVTGIVLYSKVGLPTGIANASFRLVDTDTGEEIGTAGGAGVDIVVTPASGYVTFSNITAGDFRITPGITKRVSLQITTTDTTKWLANTAMQWTITPLVLGTDPITASDGVVTTLGGSSSGLVYSYPADTNLVNIGQ
jgi:hypothetical protein